MARKKPFKGVINLDVRDSVGFPIDGYFYRKYTYAESSRWVGFDAGRRVTSPW